MSNCLPSAIAPQPRVPTAEEHVAWELERCKLDRFAAEREWADYMAAGVVTMIGKVGVNLVHFWDINKASYPLMFSIALDVLPVQASAVPCKQLFLSSKKHALISRAKFYPSCWRLCRLINASYNWFDFTETYLANKEDYTIDGKLTEFAVEELLRLGRLDELEELLSNAKELLAASTVV
ncbi:hypothetical protein B0H34DRAFT_799415 [Crassisporium funariophilum]|nr:hypothetical protein B0H34DRAFT_799415 [Crassisporium funariophilum]